MCGGIGFPKVPRKVKQKYNTNLHKQRRHKKFDKKKNLKEKQLYIFNQLDNVNDYTLYVRV